MTYDYILIISMMVAGIERPTFLVYSLIILSKSNHPLLLEGVLFCRCVLYLTNSIIVFNFVAICFVLRFTLHYTHAKFFLLFYLQTNPTNSSTSVN